MSDSDTGEASRFKIKPTESVANVEGTTNNGDNSQNPSSSQNDDNQILFTASLQKADKYRKKKKTNQSRKVILLKATDFKSYPNLRVTNESSLVK